MSAHRRPGVAAWVARATLAVLVAGGSLVAARAQQLAAQGSSLGPCCPNQASYEAAVRAFAHGDRGAASRAIARAPAGELKRAVSRLSDTDVDLLEDAAVMHLALAVRAREAGFLPQMTLHLDASHTAVHTLRNIHSDTAVADSRLRAFSGTWYLAATELYLSTGALDVAAHFVRQGLRGHAPSGGMLLAEGVVDETEAELDNRAAAAPRRGFEDIENPLPLNRRGPARAGTPIHQMFSGRTPAQQRQLNLNGAEEAYRRSLANDPESEEARLRLGRVLTLEGKDGEAQTTLAGLVAASHDQRILYLAHLFLADLATRRKDSDTAVSEYKAAIAVNPLSRIAYIGLSNLALLAGNGSDAQECIRDWSFRNTAPPDEAWIKYQDGTDELRATLNTLLRMIAQ